MDWPLLLKKETELRFFGKILQLFEINNFQETRYCNSGNYINEVLKFELLKRLDIRGL